MEDPSKKTNSKTPGHPKPGENLRAELGCRMVGCQASTTAQSLNCPVKNSNSRVGENQTGMCKDLISHVGNLSKAG